jgi:hypothetical protein
MYVYVKFKHSIFVVLTVLILSASIAGAATLNVPVPYATITAALAVANGNAVSDEIIIAAGTYSEAAALTCSESGTTFTGTGGTVTVQAPVSANAVFVLNNGITGIVLNNLTIDRPTCNSDWMRCVECGGASSITLNNCTLSGPANGIGLILFNAADAVVNDSTFSNFNSVTSWGGAIFMEGTHPSLYTDLTVDNCTFGPNCNGWIKTNPFGSDAVVGNVTVTNCDFQAASQPEALKFTDNDTNMNYDATKAILFQDCTFQGTNLEVAGFFYTSGTKPTGLKFSRCNFKAYNSTRKMMWLDLPVIIDFENCLFGGGQHENIMTVWGGPVSVNFYHCTMVNDGYLTTNKSSFITGYDFGRTFTIRNSLFYCPVSYTPGFTDMGGGGSKRIYDIDYSIVQHATPSDSTVTINGGPNYSNLPITFVDPVTRDYHLQSLSNGVNGGTDLLYTLDLDKSVRNFGPAPDMGCYESTSLAVEDWMLF